uniref:Uncharacterized protein n=1 Tax=Arundo donax TaxID=35708 RepID=A0A0A9FRH6_ARUDO
MMNRNINRKEVIQKKYDNCLLLAAMFVNVLDKLFRATVLAR